MEKKRVFLLVFLTCAVISINFVFAVDTKLDIENPPPYLKQLIPNQSWGGGGLLDAFDLDDYFGTTLNVSLNYSYSGFSNVNVSIDESNIVSFYSDSFSGTAQGYFYAFDGTLNGTSNEVYLFVAIDDEPPSWSLVEKDKGVIYQNDYVSFTSNWADNFGLRNYTFSINQGTGYSNYSGIFSGLTNQSMKSIQVSAPSGNSVLWFFCASDLSGNSNCTDVKNFTVSQKTLPPSTQPPSTEDDDDEDNSITDVIKKIFKKVDDFKLSVSSFLVSVKQGSAQTKILEITNTGNTQLTFNLSIIGLENFAVLSKNFLMIVPGESKKVSVDFFSTKDTFPGHYFGEIEIVSVSKAVIPIVFEVKPLESNIEVFVNIPDEYKSLKPGEVVFANITLKNIGDFVEEGINLHLSVIDFYGNVYDSSDEIILLSSTTSMMRNFTIAEDMPLSEYVFHARVSKDDSILSIDSDTFEVGVKFRFFSFLKSSSIFILIVLLSLFSVLLVLRYKSLAERKKGLGLYIQALELKKLMAFNKFDEAVELFIKMKNEYEEPITKEMLEDKEELKIQMKNLAKKFSLDEGPAEISKQDFNKKNETEEKNKGEKK